MEDGEALIDDGALFEPGTLLAGRVLGEHGFGTRMDVGATMHGAESDASDGAGQGLNRLIRVECNSCHNWLNVKWLVVAKMRQRCKLLEPLFIGHVIEFGFIAGVGAKGSVVFGDDGFALRDECLAEGVLVPVERHRMATSDDVIRLAVDAYSPPFAIEEKEVEFALLDECERVPCVDQFRCESEMAFGIDELHEF